MNEVFIIMEVYDDDPEVEIHSIFAHEIDAEARAEELRDFEIDRESGITYQIKRHHVHQ